MKHIKEHIDGYAGLAALLYGSIIAGFQLLEFAEMVGVHPRPAWAFGLAALLRWGWGKK